MSSSDSNLPMMILVVLAIVILGGFYYLDRSSSTPDIAAITDTADTEGMIASKKKFEAHKSAFDHSGFSGSMDEYLAKPEGGKELSSDVKEHSGYSGSGSDYVSKHSEEEVSNIMHNATEHAGFSGSMKDYAAGNYDTRNSSSHSKPKMKTSSKPAASSSSSSSHSGYGGTVDDYLDKYK